jgi:hypothetical protein
MTLSRQTDSPRSDKQLVEDFIADGFAVEQVRDGDGSYTVRARQETRPRSAWGQRR